jgi:SAM-dependent methyltransferase
MDISADKRNRFSDHYSEWRVKRIKAIVDFYGKSFFKGKTLLELGCGYGDIGAYFNTLGAVVTCTDARQEYLEIVRQRYPDVKTVCQDLDQEWTIQEHFDVIIDMGVLYHLKKPEEHLRAVSLHTTHLILETEVSDSTDPDFIAYTNEEGYDQAFNSVGCRPSPSMVENILARNKMSYYMLTSNVCNSAFHRYDWDVKNTKGYQDGLRRFWFAVDRNAGLREKIFFQFKKYLFSRLIDGN